MSSGEADPFVSIISGEPAILDEMQLLESYANTLAGKERVANVDEFSCHLSQTGATIRLISSYYPDDSDQSATTTMTLARIQESDVRFRVVLTEGDMSEASFSEYEDLEEAAVIAQELIETEKVDQRLRSIARYLQTVALSMIDVPKQENIDELLWLQGIDEVQEMEAVASELLSEKSKGITEVQEVFEIFPNNDELIILKINLDKLDLPSDEKASSPTLEIIYTNALRGLTHTYTRFYGWDRIMEIDEDGVVFEDVGIEEAKISEPLTEVETELLDFRQQLGIDDFTPQQVDVQMLIARLQAAGQLDSEE
jgi:hypothetical protein